MLYYILRPITRIALKVYFRRITINGLENIPKEGPVLLSCNHPTAFIEPCILACFLPRVLHFLVRGDLFRKPLLRTLLVGTNQIPIFRLRDGFANVKQNSKYLNMSRDILLDGKVIIIFSEGSTIEVRHVRKIQKGLARLTFDTLKAKDDLPLKIVPIGVNYLSPNDFRSHVVVNIGKPIEPTLPTEEELPKAVVRLTQEVEEAMVPLMLTKYEDKERQDKVVFLHNAVRKPASVLSMIKEDHTYFSELDKITSDLDGNNSLLRDEASRVMDVISGSSKELVNYKIGGRNIFIQLLGWLSWIPLSIAILLNGLPAWIAKYIKEKYVKQKEFLGAVQIGASMGIYLVMFILLFLIALIWKGWWAFTLFLIPLYGYLMMPVLDFANKHFFDYKLFKRVPKKTIKELEKKGENIINQMLK